MVKTRERDVSRPGCEILGKNPAHTENFERDRKRC